MLRPIIPALALVIAICPLTRALADDAKDKAAAVSGEPATQPKIRVILPASWEPATPPAASQAAAPSRSAAR